MSQSPHQSSPSGDVVQTLQKLEVQDESSRLAEVSRLMEKAQGLELDGWTRDPRKAKASQLGKHGKTIHDYIHGGPVPMSDVIKSIKALATLHQVRRARWNAHMNDLRNLLRPGTLPPNMSRLVPNAILNNLKTYHPGNAAEEETAPPPHQDLLGAIRHRIDYKTQVYGPFVQQVAAAMQREHIAKQRIVALKLYLQLMCLRLNPLWEGYLGNLAVGLKTITPKMSKMQMNLFIIAADFGALSPMHAISKVDIGKLIQWLSRANLHAANLKLKEIVSADCFYRGHSDMQDKVVNWFMSPSQWSAHLHPYISFGPFKEVVKEVVMGIHHVVRPSHPHGLPKVLIEKIIKMALKRGWKMTDQRKREAGGIHSEAGSRWSRNFMGWDVFKSDPYWYDGKEAVKEAVKEAESEEEEEESWSDEDDYCEDEFGGMLDYSDYDESGEEEKSG